MNRHAPYALAFLVLFAVGAGSIVGYSVIATPFNFAVANGDVPTAQHINKFGHNDDVDAAEDVWSRGGDWVAPTAARTHQIKSTDVDDTNTAGTGARTLRIWGLDASFLEQTEDLNLNGTTNVPTASTYTRIFRMKALTAGSTGTNEGTITATADTDATVTAEIDIGAGITHMAIWTVPDAQTFYITDAFASLNRQGATAGAQVEFELLVTEGIDTATPATLISQTFSLGVEGTSAINYLWRTPKVVVGPADVVIRAAYVSDANAVISAGFGGVYIAD